MFLVDDWINIWSTQEITYIHPDDSLMNKETKCAASTLTYTYVDSLTKLKEEKEHNFKGTDIENVGVSKHEFLQKLGLQLSQRCKCIVAKCEMMPVLGTIKLCEFKILEKLHTLLGGMHSESCVRYTLADPIVELLCKVFHFKLVLEESFNEEEFQEQVSNVSNRSRSDYVCYRLEQVEEKNNQKKSAAVVMETKYNKDLKDKKCIAQLLGYHSRATIDAKTPGIAMLLSEREARFFIFPFKNAKGQFGINSIMLPVTDIYIETDPFKSSSLLQFLLLVLVLSCVEGCTLECKLTEELEINPASSFVAIYSLKEELMLLKQEKRQVEEEKRQAEEEKRQAEEEKRRAEEEKQQADEEKRRAQKEKRQAEKDKRQVEKEKRQAEEENRQLKDRITELQEILEKRH